MKVKGVLLFVFFSILLVLMGIGCKSQYLASGILYVNQGLYEKAIVQLEKAIELEPDDPLAHAKLGQAFAEVGRYREAGREFAKAIELAKAKKDDKTLKMAVDNRDHYWAVKYNDALSQTDEEDFETARKEYAEALMLKPKDFQTLSNYGYVLSRLDSTEAAIRVFRRALDLKPDNETVAQNLSGAYLVQGNKHWAERDFAKALENYDKALELTPDNFDVLAGVADSYYQMAVADTIEEKQREYYRKAADYYEKMAKLKPDEVSVLFNLGLCYMGLKDADSAIRVFLDVVKKNPRDTEAHNFLGSAYYLKGEKRKSTAEFGISGALERGALRENLSEWLKPANLKKTFGSDTDMLNVLKELGEPEEVYQYKEGDLVIETWFYWQKQIFVSFLNGKETGRADYRTKG